MAGDNDPPQRTPRRGPRQRRRSGYHDPAAGNGAAAAASSALTLRLVLSCFGRVVCTASAVCALLVNAPTTVLVVAIVLAVAARIDLVVVARHKLRGEPG